MNATKTRVALGRGLGDLMHRTDPSLEPKRAARLIAEPPAGSYYADLPVNSIRANPKQPRQVFDEDALAELVESIREVGLLQPIVVRPLEDEDGYELVMGERRLRATLAAGLETIGAIVRPTQAHDLLRDALLENLHRAQLNPLEEAGAYQQLLSDFGCTQEELSLRIKRSRPHISNTIRLLQLPAQVQRRVAAGVLSAGHARAILGLGDPLAMERLAQRVVAENLSVRAVEEIVALGDRRDDPKARARVVREPNARASALAEQLVERLDTRVSVVVGAKGKGRIVIAFSGDDDLDRLGDLLNSSLSG